MQDLPTPEKIHCSFSESHWCTESTRQEPTEWLDTGVRKQGFPRWAPLWDCASVHRKASLMERARTAHPESHVVFVPGGCTAELHSGVAARRHLDPAASETHHQTADHAILCRVRVSGRSGAGPANRPSHGALVSARLHRGGEKDECHNESLAPPLLDLASTSMAHSSRKKRHLMRRSWNKKSHQKKRTSLSMTTTSGFVVVDKSVGATVVSGLSSATSFPVVRFPRSQFFTHIRNCPVETELIDGTYFASQSSSFQRTCSAEYAMSDFNEVEEHVFSDFIPLSSRLVRV